MVERAPQQTKQEEQYPLLKVDGGGDGNVPPQLTPTLVTPGWGVTCAPKQSWLVRWPEYISACWMTLILLGISFLVFYSLGMEAYRRQPVLLIKGNGSKPASDVFYHQVIPRGSSAFMMLYADYLSNMANEYPLLHFHVYFLIDDSIQSGYRVPRHPRFINTLIPISLSNTYPLYKLDDNNKRELAEFQRKHPNINVTIMPLSKYMAMTPLKYKWRNIPLPYLSFYARVFSVWQYGGVGMDLCTYNNYFNNRQYIDRRVSAILKQHNDGINPEDYINALNKIDREEETEFFSMFYGLIHSILNETRSFLSKTFPMPRVALEKDVTPRTEALIRLHRNKRENPTTVSDINSTEKSPVFMNILNSTNTVDLKKNEYKTINDNEALNPDESEDGKRNDSVVVENSISVERLNKSQSRPEAVNKSEHPQLVLFYDFSVFSDSIAPSMIMPDAFMHPGGQDAFAQPGNPDVYVNTVNSDVFVHPANSESFVQSGNGHVEKENKPIKYLNSGSYLLSLHGDGTFIAASTRLHPFLGHLISAGCQRMHPKAAIQDTILTQCSGIFKDDAYCNSIYLL